jgi:AraC-like DNA-binding protein
MRSTTPAISRSDVTAVGLRWDYQLGGLAPPLVGNHCYDVAPSPTYIDFHEALEFGIVLRGVVERQWGAYTVRLGPGDVWLCGMWEPHGARQPAAGGEYVLLIFVPESLLSLEGHSGVSWQSLFLAPPEQRPGILPSALRSEMRREGRMIAREIADLPPGWSSSLAVHLLRCLWHLALYWQQVTPSAMISTVSPEMLARIRPALHLVSGEQGRVALEKAAAQCGLSRTRFSALFTKTMGMSFGRFCLQIRLGHVSRLLLTTDRTIGTIADSLGFSSTAHLHRLFLKYYQCTPNAFRKEKGHPDRLEPG